MRIDLTHIENVLGDINGFVSDKAVKIAARVVKERIIELSTQGLDAFGNPFPQVQTKKGLRAYTLGYESYKERRGGETSFRNLTLTGVLLPSIYLDGNDLRFPEDMEAIAEGNIYLKTNSEIIKFWDVSDETIELAMQEVEQELEAEIEGWISNE